MLIDLSKLLNAIGEEKIVECSAESEEFNTGYTKYPIAKGSQCIFKFTKKIDKKIDLSATIKLELVIPCDRCLKDVIVDFDIFDTKEIDMGESSEQRIEALDEIIYMEDNDFDTEKFIHNELMLNLPVKVLCKEDCKGICLKCGKDLNDGDCHCDTTELDPRMSKVLDVFNQFKEV